MRSQFGMPGGGDQCRIALAMRGARHAGDLADGALADVVIPERKIQK